MITITHLTVLTNRKPTLMKIRKAARATYRVARK